MSERTSDKWKISQGSKVDLKQIATGDPDGAPGDKKATKEASEKLREELIQLQERLYAEGKQSVLLVLQALDAGGKDGTIRSVFAGVNPQGVQVHSFKAPTEEELAHDFLWRIHSKVPRKGDLTVFNRSHYEDVLIVRVHNLVEEKVWRPRYQRIREFEEQLVTSNTKVVKVFLHISQEEQRERLQDRIDNPTKHWKFASADLEERKLWDDYQAAFEEAIAETSTDDAPWYVVPADRNWYRNWVVLSILVDALKELDPQYPAPEEGIESIIVE